MFAQEISARLVEIEPNGGSAMAATKHYRKGSRDWKVNTPMRAAISALGFEVPGTRPLTRKNRIPPCGGPSPTRDRLEGGER